ncbi:MAG: hypothetical protein ACM3PY_06590 [Omnitrophica WOR_2 bacterium]
MRKTIKIAITGLLWMFFLAACSGSATQSGAANGVNPAGSPVSNQSGGGFQAPDNSDATPSFGKQDCPESPASTEKPAVAKAAGLESGSWYRNPDGSIWIGTPASGAHKGENQFNWVVPAGAQVQISGMRLDIMAAPMTANLPSAGSGGIFTGTLDFPTDGCWQVAAQAGEKTAQFILYVAP